MQHHIKAPVDPAELEHRNLRGGEFWRAVPAYAQVDEATFLDHIWQGRHSVKTTDELFETIGGIVDPTFLEDAKEGFRRAPMAVRVSPYMIASIDWTQPYEDPIRRQFIPVASKLLPDHPRLTLDSLHEQDDAPVQGLTHRYVDKVLFLPLQTCPVYCRFCTRSYAIGPDTESVDKAALAKTPEQWKQAFAYIASRPEIEDVVISGGDVYQMAPKNVALNEITEITRRAMNLLFERAITVRNQSVLIRGVNDDPHTMTLLVKRLSWVNVHPYYVYMHDLVKGVEEMRTSVQTSVDLEKHVRGATAGFNTPLFICDAPGGGGKRDIHSFDYYDRANGIAVYSAPSVKPGQSFLYFDPIDTLSPEAQARWAVPLLQDEMIREAVARAGGKVAALA